MNIFTKVQSFNLFQIFQLNDISKFQRISGYVYILFFIIFNPFLALFFSALFSLYFESGKNTFLICSTISFTFLFFFRKFGIEANNVSDDTVTYLEMFHSNKNISIIDVFSRFFDFPSGNEPIYHLVWWPFANLFNVSDNSFLFLHYLLIFASLFKAFSYFSRKYYLVLIFLFFFFTPQVLDTVAFVWRQQLAFSMFLIGIGQLYSGKKKSGLVFVYFSPFVHLSAFYFVFIFLLFRIFVKFGGFKKKQLLFLFIAIIFIVLTLVMRVFVNYLDATGYSRILFYISDDSNSNNLLLYSSIIYSVFILFSYVFLYNDELNQFFIVMILSVFVVMFSFPSAIAIFGRFSSFTIPFLGIYFYRLYLLNFSKKYNILVISFIFILGFLRVFRGYNFDGAGVFSLLAFNNPFDPFMGLIKMIFQFGIDYYV
jgi:hypothetical protein